MTGGPSRREGHPREHRFETPTPYCLRRAAGLTAADLQRLGIIDDIIPEPLGGAHRNHRRAAELLKTALVGALDELSEVPVERLLEDRYTRLRNLGRYFQELA